MHRLDGTNLFYYSHQLETDMIAAYVFIKDYKDMVVDPLNKRTTETIQLGADMEMTFTGEAMAMSWLTMPDWKKPVWFDKKTAKAPGSMEEGELESKVLETKVPYSVYLPGGYHQTKVDYPIAYILDGSDALNRGDWQKALDRLVHETVAPFIAVFIKHPARSPKYADMVANEMVAHIEGTYRVRKDAAARTAIGISGSGPAAIQCALQFPDLFGQAGTQSAFLFDFAINSLTPLVGKVAEEKRPRVYLDWGRYDLRNPAEGWDVGGYNKRFTDILKDQGYTVMGGEQADGFDWLSFRTRTHKMLEALFPKKS